jgi:hypothetical protein
MYALPNVSENADVLATSLVSVLTDHTAMAGRCQEGFFVAGTFPLGVRVAPLFLFVSVHSKAVKFLYSYTFLQVLIPRELEPGCGNLCNIAGQALRSG